MTERELQNIATESFKDVIRREGLIDSGKLLNEARAEVVFKKNTFEIKLIGPSYLTFLNADHNIVGQVAEDDKVIDAIAEFFATQVEESMNKIFR